MAERDDCDVIVVGGGHNGLVCASYLAQAGLSVTVLERRPVVGGAAVTEEFYPGFRNSIASYTVSLLHPQIIADLRLVEHGLEIRLRPLANFFPLGEDALSLHADPAATRSEFARFSAADAAALPNYLAMLDSVSEVIRGELLRTPPNSGHGLASALSLLAVGWRARKLDARGQRALSDMLTKSVHDVLSIWFENPNIKAAFAFDSTVGHFASPLQPGTAYGLLHHVVGEANGVRGAWGHAVGGMGAITQAMLAEAEARGVTVETSCEVSEVLVQDGVAVGVATADGERLRAPRVVSNVAPKLLYLSLVGEQHLDAEVVRRMRTYRSGSATFRMNVALSELPDFRARPGSGPQPHHQAGIVIGPTVDYLEAAYLDARRHGWSREPIVEMLLPSTVDDSLAPSGAHVASLFCQHFAPTVDWQSSREAAVETIFATIERHAPNFRRAVLGYQALSPLDLEQTFGLVDGDIFHGALGLDQLWSNRPMLGYSDYRTPIRNLYLCGAGAHPGGGVSGIPGHNCAREIIDDARR